MKYTENYNLKKPEAEDFYNVEDFNENMEIIDGELKNLEDNKVDKIPGKDLSTNDYTTEEKNKLAGIEAGANKYVHPSTHSANMITENTNKRFVTDTEKATWNAKETPAGAQAKADAAESAAKSYTDTHENKTSTHGMTATPTASRGAMYDSGKRLSSGAAPSNDNHVVRKVDLDSHINSVSAHSATATPTASRIAMYDSGKRLSSGAAPTGDNHVVRKIDIDNVETVNFTFGQAYVIRNFVHLHISGGGGVEGELITTLPSSVRPITPICGVALTSSVGAPFGNTSKLFSIGMDGSVYCYDKATAEDVYISAFYIKG